MINIPIPTPSDFFIQAAWDIAPWYIKILGYIGLITAAYITVRFIMDFGPWTTRI